MQPVRNRFKWIPVVLFLLVFSSLIIPVPSAFSAEEAPKINAMTRNLYLGADIFKVVEAAQTDPNTIPFVVAEVYQTMLFTNFWARAEAIADEIAANKPQVVGLQEVSTFYKQTPGDFMAGNPTQASDVVIDFYTVLNAALEARGMYYDKFEVTNADVELPMADLAAGPPYYLSDVRMVDHDVILVRKGHAAVEVLSGNYLTNLSMELGGVPLEFTRGYLAVDVDVKGDVFRFVSTHLEVRSSPGSVFRVIQAAQMQELIGRLAYLTAVDPKPVVLVGDFNSSPEDVPGYGTIPSGETVFYVPPYMQAVYAGYLDAWLQQDNYGEGYTSGFDEYVSDPTAQLTSRIDLIFLNPLDLAVDKVKCEIVGNEVSDMVPNPAYPGAMLWPSDHAGVVGKIKFLE